MGRVVGDFIGQQAEQYVSAEPADLDARFIRFVATHRERARRMAWRLVGGDEAVADDVTQEAFLKAYAGLSKFRDESSLDTWFFRILVRQAGAWRRWRKVRDFWGGTDAGPGTPEPAVDVHRDPQLQAAIGSALARLTAPQREAFVLVHLEGFTVRQAATMMAKAEGTVKSHLHRALQSLRGDLAQFQNAQFQNDARDSLGETQ
ncbi:MAG: RNA polymerase sigma-70 factor (ECF subfamily) [Hyphomicrobiaceae bacterium]|jgi:RNA polymerase sigma-70 factor (ECF subfamily)